MPKRWVVGGIWAILMPVATLMSGLNAKAEQPAAPGRILISDVIISGNNHRLSTEEIRTHLHTRPGKEYKPDVVDEDVRNLYKTNQFSNIKTLLEEDGRDRVKIYFVVCEMPNIVQKVTFLDAKHLKPDDLQDITGVRPGAPLNPNLNRHGCQKVIDKYAEMGRFFADCQLIKGGDPVDTEVIYQITEGKKVTVHDIHFTGNRFFDTEKLRQKVPARVGGTYTCGTAEAGMQTLSTLYREAGYRKVRIALEIERESAPGEITLMYHIREGLRYRKADKSSD